MAQPIDAPEVVPATQKEPQESKWSNFETVFTNAKAGMGGVDKEHVKRIVYEMSKVGLTLQTRLWMTPSIPLQAAQLTVVLCCRTLHTSKTSRESRHRQSSASKS